MYRPAVRRRAPGELDTFLFADYSGAASCLWAPRADLDHLVFLPSGDAAVTRRARKLSTRAAVVLKWSRARSRYERQGLLVEEDALQEAEAVLERWRGGAGPLDTRHRRS